FDPTSTIWAEPCASKWVKRPRALRVMAGAIINTMRIPPRLVGLLALLLITAAPRGFGQALPDLGSAGDATLSPALERRLGESIMREIRFREPTYVDDPEVSEYLATLGGRLTQVSVGARQ